MSQTSVNAASIIRPESVQDLVVEPLTKQSLAFQLSTVVEIDGPEARFPILTGDPTASWTAESAEIDISAASFDDLTVTVKKVSALTVVSNELASDSSPAAASLIGQRLVESLRATIDSAYFGAAVENGPSGLGSISPTVVYGGDPYANADGFIEAQAAVEQLGQKVDHWVASPSTVVALSKLKRQTGSNEPLLSDSAAGPVGRSLVGVPLLAAPEMADGLVLGVPRARSFVVLRKGTTVDIDSSAFFSSDRTAIRAIARLAFAFPQPAAIVSVLADNGDAS